MKKTNKIIALIVVLMLGVIALTGCEFGGEKREINAKSLTGYTEYTHSSGCKFQYPSTWRSNGLSSTPGFVNSSNGTNVNIISESAGITNLKAYVKLSVENIKKTYSSGKLLGNINEEYVKLNGRDACILDYKVNQMSINMNVKQAVIIDNGQAYILTVVLRESSEATDTEIADDIISTFQK